MEEKHSGFSLNRRLLHVLRRRAEGQGGVTLVEMTVSLFIFAVVSTLFAMSIVQYLHTTSSDTIRARSSTEIATSVRSLDQYIRNAEGVKGEGGKITLVTYESDGVKQCAVIDYTEATWSGKSVDSYGSVTVRTRPYDAGSGAWSRHVVLGSVMNSATATTADDALFNTSLFAVDASTRVVRYSPVTGSFVGGKPVTSNTSTSFTARNVTSGASVDFSKCG